MKDISQITEELVQDAFNACLNDSDYLMAFLRTYFYAFTSEADRRRMHQHAFEEEYTEEEN